MSCVIYFIYSLLLAIYGRQAFAAKYTPTKGEVWPTPAEQIKYKTVYSFDSDYFNYEVKDFSCKLLSQAIHRAKKSISSIEGIAKNLKKYSYLSVAQRELAQEKHEDRPALTELQIDLKSDCEEYPHANMDERYSLNISSISGLQSNSIWGIIRGLETFTQMFYLSDNYKDVLINGTHIDDYPQYPHRGLLLDTGRHFLSMDTILRTLDAMAMNKMNVFHWHIVDEESFPYQSEKFPELSAKGAFHPLLVYTEANIRLVIQYARVRGIRVIPEIDGPGHVTSWGKSHPDILTECSYRPPLNPIKVETYSLLKGLYKELQELFPDTYFHLGGDEVNTECWTHDKDISAYMKKHNMSNVNDLHAMFLERTLPLLKIGTTPVVWEEVFFNAKAPMTLDIAVQVWGWGWQQKMYEILATQHKVIFSSYWYLDYKVSDHPFDEYYGGDPRAMMSGWVSNKSLSNILGGEACMWGELADDNNIMARVWPRASAIAEVLWSVTGGKVPADAHQRLEEHTCRMNRRGVGAEPPSGPGFCITVKNTR